MTPRYRVLYVEPANYMGGSVVSLLRLLRRLDRRTYEPVVLLWRPNEISARFRDLDVPVVFLHPEASRETTEVPEQRQDRADDLERLSPLLAGAYRELRALYWSVRLNLPEAWQIRQLIRRHRIDLVHLNNRLYNTRSAALAAWLAGVPSLCHLRYFDPFHLPDRGLARSVTEFIYISRAVAEAAARRNPGLKGTVIYDGLELTEPLSRERVQDVRARYGLRSSDFVIANFGRLVPWKGQDVFLRALARVASQLPEWQALIVGATDPSEDRRFEPYLLELRKALGLSTRVHFTGHCDRAAELMSAVDVIVHSASSPEPFGLVVIEGMAAAKPVIATQAGGVLDSIEDGQTGLLVPPNDVEAMAKAILRVANDRTWADCVGVQARERVAAQFTLEQYAARIESVYERCLGLRVTG
jgi:glycosyltransferase involved in cell wall biosynthesis